MLDSSARIYGKDYGLIYFCVDYPVCDAYVGVHEGTTEPLGRLANKELREWKIKAHAAFDPLWKAKLKKRQLEKGEIYKKHYARGSGYKWLATQLGIKKEECHIGMFDIDMCKKVVDICMPYTNKIGNKKWPKESTK
jgi:hypothetical protein